MLGYWKTKQNDVDFKNGRPSKLLEYTFIQT